jgi:anti-anti-sigma factor
MLHMRERPTGDVMILDLQGRMASGAAETALGDKVRSVLLCGYRKLLLNLAEVTSSDASGVSAFVGALLAARECQAEVRLVNVTRRLTDSLIVVALYRYFSAFDTEKEALVSLLQQPDMATEAGAEIGCQTARAA